ncbi:MAG: sigma-70 family RNA polymerase sigma factor [Gemmatimonadetes bacterium]|nr:MAG: sigma-70 family RNA polymerase sigma factor [Gemmatimonadota bacterium]
MAQRVEGGADERDVRRAREGDAEAFERVYRACAPRVHSLARRMAGPGRADDLTQDVFLRAWDKLPSFRGEARFETWLHRLAVNLILTVRARDRRRAEREVERPVALESAPARAAPPGWALDFEAALAALPARARRVFVLYDIEGYTHEEIAAAMGISVGTSKSQLHRARMLMRERLR